MGGADAVPAGSSAAGEASSPRPAETVCPACGAPPSPGRWCMACGAEFAAAPAEGTLPAGGSVAAKKYSCDSCGALMLFDAETSGLKCPFCGGTKGIERDAAYLAVEYALDDVPDSRLRAEAPKTFHCEKCGAEVTFAGATISASCPFCGSDHVVERTGDAGRVLPESVLPFAVSLEGARSRWREWLGRGIFRPRGLKALASGEALKGVYVPFWTYDTKTWSRWTAEAGYHYTVTVGSGKDQRTETRTRWTFASGDRRDVFDDVLVCGSRGVDERMLAKAYPYGLDALQPYRSDYLSGWAAEEYVVDLKAGWGKAREEVNEEARRLCSGDVPGDTQRNLRVWTQHADVTWKHVLLPVWIATYRWKEKTYKFLVNGQTGKVVGTAPISPLRVAIAVVLAIAVGFGVWWLVETFRTPPPRPTTDGSPDPR
jgi:DNA-directed RNA polymerase subunit RPC12/RpoP